MTKTSTCCGCCINQLWPPPYWPPNLNFQPLPLDYFKFNHLADVKLTIQEEEVLKNLKDAWVSFMVLDKRSEADDKEYTNAIHKAQQLIALRVARRVNPEVWSQPQI